jgi:hypothetical protein
MSVRALSLHARSRISRLTPHAVGNRDGNELKKLVLDLETLSVDERTRIENLMNRTNNT